MDPTSAGFEFTYEFNEGKVIMNDDLGDSWDIFGEALSGPNKGQFLKSSHSFMIAYLLDQILFLNYQYYDAKPLN